jgi:hypothetical protein
MNAEDRERELAETRFAADLRSQFEALGERARQPRRRRRWVAIAVAVGVAVAGLLGTVALAGGFDPDSTQLPDPPLPAESVYPMNASGDTFGPNKPLVEEPDLMAVMATNGKVGYCYRTQLMGLEQEPKTPEEAEASNEANLRGRMIPVYKSDGVTQIGVFQVGGPGSKLILEQADGTTITQEADADGNIITTTVAPDGTTTIESKALDGAVTTETLTAVEAARLKETPSPTPTPSHEPDKPQAWLLDRMSSLARDAGDARATARWELQWRKLAAGIEGANAPESVYAQAASVWIVILHGDFKNGSWIYQLLDPDSHNVLSEGTSTRPFDTSKLPPMQGPITLDGD